MTLNADTRHPASRRGSSDVRRHTIGHYDDATILIVARWIDRPDEIGPSWSLFADRFELVRFDLFANGAHCHPMMAMGIGTKSLGRRYLQGGPDELRAQSVWELRRNVGLHLRAHPRQRYRLLTIPQVDLDHGAIWLEHTLTDLVACHGATR